MRFSCNLCTLLLVSLGIFAGVSALFNFNLLLFLCFGSQLAYRSFLAVCGVAALFNLYSLIVFKPYKGLK